MTESERRVQVLLGEGFLRIGLHAEAVNAFKLAGDSEGLIACGNKALEKGEFVGARLAFEAAVAIE